MRTVTERDGIHFELGQRIVADSRSAAGDINIVTHAHSDHMLQKDTGNVLCSPVTAQLVEARAGTMINAAHTHENIDLIPSGHIIGSCAARINHDDHTYLYTGDVCTRDRGYLDGFQPVDADTLVVESTYGVPAYTFPDHEVIKQHIRDWVQDNTDTPLFLFGYSLGRAQKIQHIVQQVTNRPIYAHGAITKMNEVIASTTNLSFRAKSYSEHKEHIANENAIVLLPSHLSRKDWVNELVEKTGGLKAGFSGWAAQDSYSYRGGYDATFPLSDHCDFNELVELVRTVDPDRVYTHHGFDEAFAAFLRDDYGYDARPLGSTQSRLTDY